MAKISKWKKLLVCNHIFLLFESNQSRLKMRLENGNRLPNLLLGKRDDYPSLIEKRAGNPDCKSRFNPVNFVDFSK